MKKFTLMLLALVVSVAANAAGWYISGGFQQWSHCNAAYELKAVDGQAGVFQLQLAETQNLSGEFLIVQGTPGSPNWGTKIGTNGQAVKADVPYSYRAGANNFVMDGSVKGAKITLDTNAKTLLVEGQAKENEYTTVYLVGDFGGGWNENRTDYPLSLKEGTEDTWVGTFDLTSSANYFKLRAGDYQYGVNGSDQPIELGTEYTASRPSDKSFSIGAGKYNVTFVLEKNAFSGKLTVTADGPIEYPEQIYVVGNVAGNTGDMKPNITLALPGDKTTGIYTGEVTVSDNMATGFGYFQLSTGTAENATDWSGLKARYGAEEKDMPAAAGTFTIVASGDPYAWKIAQGTYTFTVNLPEKTLVIENVAAPLHIPDQLYIIGDINYIDWQPKNALEMTKDASGKVFTVNASTNLEDGRTKAAFSFLELKADAWDGDTQTGTQGVNDGYRWGAPAADTPIEAPVEGGNAVSVPLTVYTPNVNASACNSYTLDAFAEYTFTVDFSGTEPVLTVAYKTTGVEGVSVENNAAVEYYTLEGIRVNAPESGIYIRRQGNKVSKIAL